MFSYEHEMTPDPEHDQLQEEVGFGGSSFAEAPPTSGYNRWPFHQQASPRSTHELVPALG